MSELYLWAPRLFFMWQLLWLLVHGAPAQFPKLALDPALMTSISPEENEPSPNPQEISAQEPEAPEVEPYSIEEEASTQSAVSPKLLKSLFVYGVQEDLPTTPGNSESSINQRSSDLLQFPPASIEPSPIRRKGLAHRPKNSMYLKVTVSPLGSGKFKHPVLPYDITPLPPKNIKFLAAAKEVTAYFEKFTEGVEPPSQEEVPLKLSETTQSSSSRPTSEADAAATIAPPEHPHLTLSHQEPVQAQQQTWSEITGWPLNLELTIEPEAAMEGEQPTAMQQTIAPPEPPHLTLPHLEPDQAQQPTGPEITGGPLDLELTIKPEAAVQGAHPTTLQLTTAPPKHPQVTLPHPEPIQAQQPTWPEITGGPLDLELTIKPEAAVQGAHPTTPQLTTAPLKHPQVTLPHPEPIQAQQPTWPEITGGPLDLELTIKPEAAVQGAHPTTLQLTTASPKHPQVTLPHPEPIQAQQPTWPEITGGPLDLELTIKPEAAVQGAHPTTLQLTTASPKHPQVTLPHPEPIQAQQPTWPEITGGPLDLELTIKPEAAVQGAHPTTPQLTTAPLKHPQVTLPHPEPIQAQQPTWPEITGGPLDLELTIKPEAAVQGAHPTTLQLTTASPKHPQVTLPHPEPIQAQQPTWPEITGGPLDLELTIKPEAAVQGAHPTTPQLTTAPLKHPQVTLPHPEPIQAQQPTWPEITGGPLDLELTIKPEAAVQGAHPTTPQLTTAPPKHPQVTLPHQEHIQAQQPTWPEITGGPLDLELTIKPEAAVQGTHPTTPQLTTASSKHPQVTLPHPEPIQAQQPIWPGITGQPLNLEVSIKPEVAVKGEQPTTPQQTTTPLELPHLALQHPETVSTHYSSQYSDMMSPTSDEQFVRIHHPVPSETGPPTAVQNGITNVCELCTCSNDTLLCTGFGPKQKLHGVPVLQPNTHKGTFTTLNLKGNSISRFDKDVWKSYHETEKLILSDNNLRELRKESFEGLLFLKYLDLSGNNIKFIEEGTFEALPFLEYLNLGGNLLTEVSSGTFQAWHGMQFLHTIILHHNPLTTIDDSYFLKLPALQYLDLGKTQVSLTTVENILMTSSTLEKLILPRHLACCLCQVKSTIETVSRTVRLHCDTECLTKTQCGEEESHLSSEEGSFLKVLQGRKNTSTELMIEPERMSSEKNDDNLSAFLNLLMKLLNEQEETKVSKAEWEVQHWETEKTEAPEEEEREGEEEEALGPTNEVPGPGYVYRNKVLVATPVIAVASGFIMIACLILICGRAASKEDKERKSRSFLSGVLSKKRSRDSKSEVSGFWSRLKGLFRAPRTVRKRNELQLLRDKDSSDEIELLDQMEKGEGSVSTARTGSMGDTTTD